MKTYGSSKILFIVGVLFFFILCLVLIIYIGNTRSRSVDAARLAHMTLIQSALHRLYAQEATYFLGESCTPGAFLHSEACFTKLSSFIQNSVFVKDPSGSTLKCVSENCSVRNCDYTIGQEMNKDGYKIYFHIEKGFEGFAPGCHYLDQNGIH